MISATKIMFVYYCGRVHKSFLIAAKSWFIGRVVHFFLKLRTCAWVWALLYTKTTLCTFMLAFANNSDKNQEIKVSNWKKSIVVFLFLLIQTFLNNELYVLPFTKVFGLFFPYLDSVLENIWSCFVLLQFEQQ